MSHATLIDLWFVLTAGLLFLHIGLGSIDLGVCTLSLITPDKDSETLLGSIDTIWHANQTWLVVLGGTLFGAFPVIYSEVLSRLYGLVIVLLAMLAMRGIGLEYRHHAANPRRSRLFAGCGALAAIVAEGLILGTLIVGAPAPGSRLAGLSALIRPEVLPTVLFLIFTALLTAGAWLLKELDDEHPLRPMARRSMMAGAVGVLAFATYICRQMLAAWRIDAAELHGLYMSLAAVAFAALVLMTVSMQKSWRGSQVPWALVVVGVALAACAGTARFAMQTPGAADFAASREALVFLTWTSALLLPPLIAFQIFQYRLQRRGADVSTTESGGQEPSAGPE
ncbi:cytochrome d ubiquinol oxidase subunit II [Oceanidesulfovibrio marinus]|uniref:Cytochrome d ubiquinol oxidase subunit II n=1 Tax=Oceanidesulfovibrio marinus TaxID=370038 RepID=A0A6P1ZJ18_9BACT|nr:cytochrome d ubiquinol oxidase subunit II [Oceanidesulfovibrio marinus]TVM33754.1 hypothetical protein DQK91_11080 [Oceanidesulfovibrio marinus]